MDTESVLQSILKRNEHVEWDKRWERSLTRRLSLTLFTYLLALLFLLIIGAERAFLAAIVPAMGFWLSTLSASILRPFWERIFRKNG